MSAGPAPRHWGVSIVHGREKEAVFACLVDALGDRHMAVQETALEALLRQGVSDVARQLCPLLRRDVTIRNLAVDGLQRLGMAAVDVVVEAANDPDPHIRKLTAVLLGQVGSADTVHCLVRLMDDECDDVRAAAATALGRVPHSMALHALLHACHDPVGRIFPPRFVEG